MEFFLIYLFVMVEKLAYVLDKGYSVMFAGLALIVGTIVLVLLGGIDRETSYPDQFKEPVPAKGIKVGKWLTVCGLIIGLSGSLLPNQKELAIIVGSGITYNVLTSEPAKQIGGKAIQLLEQKIDSALADEKLNIDKLQNQVKEKVKETGKAVVIEKIEGAKL